MDDDPSGPEDNESVEGDAASEASRRNPSPVAHSAVSVAVRTIADSPAFKDVGKHMAAAQASSLGAIADRFAAEQRSALGALSAQIAATQTQSLSAIAARIVADSPAFRDVGKHMAAAQASSLGAIADRFAAEQRSALGALSAQIAATQTQSLSAIAARIVADSPAFRDVGKHMAAAQASSLGAIADRFAAEQRSALGALSAQIAATQTQSLSAIAARIVADSPAFRDVGKHMAAAQASSLGAIADRFAAEQRSALGALSAQIAATQTQSLSAIAARIVADSPAFRDVGKHMAAAQASSLGAIADRFAAEQRSALGALSAQIAATQTQSLSAIAARIVADSPASNGLAKRLEASRVAVLGELTLRASEMVGTSSLASVVAEFARRYESWNSFAGSTLQALGSLRPDAGEAARTTLGSAAVASLTGLDRYTPGPARLAQFAATSHLAEQTVGPGALTSWRASLESNRRVSMLRAQGPSTALDHLSDLARNQTDLTSWVVQQKSGHRLLSDLSGRPVLAWRDRLAQTIPDSTEIEAGAVLVAGQATLGLVGGDLLTSVAWDDDISEEANERVEGMVLAPWEEARVNVFRDLYAVLASLDPTVPELLDGAWDEVDRAGPAAAVKAANCVIEVVDRTFRAAAPDDKVREWHEEGRRPKAEWEGESRPPHALRAKYLARNLGDDRELIEAQADAFAVMSRRIRKPVQKIKHASRGDITKVKALLLSAEYLLVSLLLGGEDGDR
ncbi:hypothetical protein [Actinacidiphila yeochonensis]|uniref:hypothetical protein n=1 Tax=Actinacidiphila yeochonensis TaxID=89050 RepID=UPI00056A8724|nr:hypothetical protein [Actinacidiphila yeochonensis]